MDNNEAYLSGFANHFASEALPGALPKGQNSPQKPAYGLYTEQLSGSAFTAPRHHNLRSWLYRIRPSVVHGEFTHYPHELFNSSPLNDVQPNPNQMRWDPLPIPQDKTDFIDGIITYAGHGNVNTMTGAAVHLYAINASMQDCYFYNADGEMLIVPQQGSLCFHTEMGRLTVAPSEIIVIPRGIKFQVTLESPNARGYLCENYGTPFSLPELGPIGANGLANPRDFLYPTAHYQHISGKFKLLCKYQGLLWETAINHSPLDVVAWHGNYAPYKYHLSDFNTINTVSFDHPDPSLFTVLTSQSHTPGVANVDFVIFPSRWMVAEHSFRPPYYHRNIMSELMGLIHGKYDAKQTGFWPGGISLHNCMQAHGPDNTAYEQATNQSLTPQYYHDTLAFMFESHYVWRLAEFAMNSDLRQKDYKKCWEGFKINFSKNNSG